MLPPAPARPIGPDGQPRWGKYQGLLSRVQWDTLPRPFERLLREKAWFYLAIADARVVMAAAVIDVGWSMSGFAYLFDREAGALRADVNAVAPPLLAGRVSRSPQGDARFVFPGLSVAIEQRGGRARLEVRARQLQIDATLDLVHAPPPLVAISPVPGGIIDCTQKTSAIPVLDGEARTGNQRLNLRGAWAAMDFTCGLLARETQWRWASAWGVAADGRPVGLNLTTGFNAEEDAVWIGRKLHPVRGAQLEFDQPLGEWRVRTLDGRVDLRFTPEGHRAQNTNLVLAKSIYTQPIGSFTGVVRPDGEGEVRFERVPGVTEVHLAKW